MRAIAWVQPSPEASCNASKCAARRDRAKDRIPLGSFENPRMLQELAEFLR